jgi:pyruvate/2-oxoglutarate dehydrogenase complex dihydrolipoamide acyltransferase (E2) component
MRIVPIARERRHTLHFLREIRAFAPVFIDTEVDMSAIQSHRAAASARGASYSVITYVLYAAGRVLARHPEANAAIRGRAWPRVARYDDVNGKITLDKTVGGHRIVVSTVLPDLRGAGLTDIQAEVDRHRGGDPGLMPEYEGMRLLHRLPLPLGGALYRLVTRPLRRRHQLMGTFAVTSLSHRPVDGFASVGGTTITLGLGQVADRPVVRDGEIVIAPMMRLTLTFDHRVLDGAEGADVLADLRTALTTFDLAGELPPSVAGDLAREEVR